MDANTELAELRKEVAVLKEQLAELRQFLRVERGANGTEPPSLKVICREVQLRHPVGNVPRGGLRAHQEGALLELLDHGTQARVSLQASEGEPGVALINHAGLPIIALGLNGADQPSINLCDGETIRAALQIEKDGGSLHLNDANGMPRVLIKAENDAGSFGLMNSDLNPGVQMRSDAGNGGWFCLHFLNGQPAVSMSTGPHRAMIFNHFHDGNPDASLPDDLTEEDFDPRARGQE